MSFDGSVEMKPEHLPVVDSLSLDDQGTSRPSHLPSPPASASNAKLTFSPSDFDLSPVSARLLLPTTTTPRSSRADTGAAKFHWQREVSKTESPDLAFTRAPWRPGVPTHTDRALRNSAGRPLFALERPSKPRSPLSSVYTSPLTVVSAPDTPPPPLDLPR